MVWLREIRAGRAIAARRKLASSDGGAAWRLRRTGAGADVPCVLQP